MKTKIKNNKQGECGFFCFKYWIGSGCDEDCPVNRSRCNRIKELKNKIHIDSHGNN